MSAWRRLAGIVTMLTLAPVQHAGAECAPDRKHAREAMADYDLVFSGTATTTGYPPTFTVHRVWKGNVPAKMTLYTVPAIESLTLIGGGSWVVFAREVVSVEDQRERGDTGELLPIHDVSVCSPTRPLSEAKDILKQLGPGKRPRRSGGRD